MNAIVAIDPEARTARVQPGVMLDALRDAARPHGLTFGPDPDAYLCTSTSFDSRIVVVGGCIADVARFWTRDHSGRVRPVHAGRCQ